MVTFDWTMIHLVYSDIAIEQMHHHINLCLEGYEWMPAVCGELVPTVDTVSPQTWATVDWYKDCYDAEKHGPVCEKCLADPDLHLFLLGDS